MNTPLLHIAASVALCALGLLLLAMPELGHRMFPIDALTDRNFAVRLFGVGLMCAVFLAWSIKDFVET